MGWLSKVGAFLKNAFTEPFPTMLTYGLYRIPPAIWEKYGAYRRSSAISSKAGLDKRLSMSKPGLKKRGRWEDTQDRDRLYQALKATDSIFVYTPDPDGIDNWEVPVAKDDGKIYNDCDGFAAYAKDLLLKDGWAESMLRLTVCDTESGGSHMVLCVTLEDIDVILDNRYSKTIKPYHKLPYKWVYREDGNGSFERLSDPRFH